MLYAYLDESGTHAQSPVTLIGGWIASPELWAAIEPDWAQPLANLGVPYFHASECDAGDGTYQNLSRPLRESLFNGLAQVIARHKPLGINVAITRRHFEETEARGVEPFESPYHACFEFCMQQLSKWSTDQGDGETIAVIFEEHKQYEPQGRLIYDLFQRSRWAQVFASLELRQADQCVPLQAADLLVYEKTRREVERFKDPDAPYRRALDIMGDADVQVIDYLHDTAMLKELLERGTL